MSTAIIARREWNQLPFSDAYPISIKKGGERMLHFKLFAFEVTICLHRLSAIQRYHDDQRIKQLTGRLTDERIRLNRRTW
ncbi:MAG: hypothetical protein ABF820_07285 [Sporolactobacillus sp.]